MPYRELCVKECIELSQTELNELFSDLSLFSRLFQVCSFPSGQPCCSDLCVIGRSAR